MANSILYDIFDLGKSLKSMGTGAMRNAFGNGSSLARQAKQGTLQFPVAIDRSIDIAEASMVTKALEREFVSFVRVATSLNSSTTEKDITGYLKKLHQNYDNSSVFGMTESARMAQHIEGMALDKLHEMHMGLTNLFEESDLVLEHTDLSLQQRSGLVKMLKGLNEGECVRTAKGLYLVNENTISEVFLAENSKGELSVYKTLDVPRNFRYETRTSTIERKVKSSLLAESEEFVYPFNESCLNDFTHTTGYNVITKGGAVKLSEAEGDDDDDDEWEDDENTEPDHIIRVHPRGDLMDNDVKKANELVPTILRLVTNFVNEDGKLLRTEEYLIGVKAEMHPISTGGMIENLVNGVKRNNSFFNFLKYTSGEISFFKDLLLGLNNIKKDVKTRTSKQDKWLAVFLNRKSNAKILNKFSINKKLLPNSTIVVSQEVINLIKQQYKIDLNDVKKIKTLMSTYYLIAFVIVDPSNEVCKFIFEPDKDFTTYSYASLERENSNKTKEISNIMQVLGKM